MVQFFWTKIIFLLEKKKLLQLLAAVRIDAREHGTWIKVPKGHAKKN